MIKICILAGGNSPEHEISLKSADNIKKNLDSSRYEITTLQPPANKSTQWIRELLDNPPDIVLNAMHGGNGENGAVQGLLDCLDIPYVGCGVVSSALCMDKHLSKIIMKNFHIPVIEDVFLKESCRLDYHMDEIIKLGFPVIVKPNRGGSSLGISVADSIKSVREAVNTAKEYDSEIIIEKYINGREINCGILQNNTSLDVMPIIDINVNKQFYDYGAKYVDENTAHQFSSLPEFMQTMIKEIAKKAFVSLKCTGFAAIDMIIAEEQVFVIELNTLPGLTERSLIPKAADMQVGGFDKFLDSLIKNNIKKRENYYE